MYRIMQVKFLVRLSELDFEISMLSLSTLIGLPLDIISKRANILSKLTEPKVSSAMSSNFQKDSLVNLPAKLLQ